MFGIITLSKIIVIDKPVRLCYDLRTEKRCGKTAEIPRSSAARCDRSVVVPRSEIVQTVRRHITEILKENGSATVAQLADSLGMAQVSVRHHLSILMGEGLVELVGVRRHNGAGRPSQVYALTSSAARLFPQRHDVLANNVLAELKASLPDAEVRALLQRVAARTARQAPSAGPDQTLEERLDEVAVFLTDQGYNARWVLRDGCFELHACNCPFSGVSDQNPEICAMDQALLQQLLPTAVRQQSRVMDGAARCTYLIEITPAIAEGM